MSTFRVDLVNGMLSMLDDFIAANPTLLIRRFRIRPPSFTTDLPAAYLDLRPEEVSYTQGTQTRAISPSIVVVDNITDNGETMDRLDSLTDALVTHFGGYPSIVPRSAWDRMTISDEVEDNGDGTYMAAVRFSFGNVTQMDGRL